MSFAAAVIGLARTLARHVSGGDDVDLVAQVIECQQTIEKHQYAIGQGKIIFGVFADIFQLPHCVVSEVAHRARGERRQPGHRGGTMLPQQFLDDLDRVSLALLLLLAAPQFDVATARPHLHVRTRSQKRVAPNLLAALYRLQQKSVRLIGGNREESGNRRQQIRRDRFHHRHQRGLSGKPGEFLVIGTKHGLSHSGFSHYRQGLSHHSAGEPVKSNGGRASPPVCRKGRRQETGGDARPPSSPDFLCLQSSVVRPAHRPGS